MPIYDELREKMQGKKSKSKEKPNEDDAKPAKKPMKKAKKMGKSSALVGAAGLPKNAEELLMPMGKKGTPLGLLFDKLMALYPILK